MYKVGNNEDLAFERIVKDMEVVNKEILSLEEYESYRMLPEEELDELGNNVKKKVQELQNLRKDRRQLQKKLNEFD